MIEMIEHFAKRGDYMALLFITVLTLRVFVLIWQMIKEAK
jgi:hypothetical protein